MRLPCRRPRYHAAATVADVAASIGKRLAKDALAGKVDGKVVDVYATVPDGAKVEIVTPKSRGRARHDPPLHRPPHGHGRAGALPRDAGHHRPGDRERLLLRLRHRPPVQRRRPPPHRGEDGGDREARPAGQPRGVVAATRPSRSSTSSARTTRSRSSTASPATRRSRSTARASGSISAAARTSPPPAASARSS